MRANPSHSRASSLPSLLSSYLLKMVSAFSLTRGSFPTPPNIASNRRYSASMASVSSATSRLGSESSPSRWLMPAHFSNTSFRTASNSLDKIRSIHCCFCARALPAFSAALLSFSSVDAIASSSDRSNLRVSLRTRNWVFRDVLSSRCFAFFRTIAGGRSAGPVSGGAERGDRSRYKSNNHHLASSFTGKFSGPQQRLRTAQSAQCNAALIGLSAT